jgi:hypothetical protein
MPNATTIHIAVATTAVLLLALVLAMCQSQVIAAVTPYTAATAVGAPYAMT